MSAQRSHAVYSVSLWSFFFSFPLLSVFWSQMGAFKGPSGTLTYVVPHRVPIEADALGFKVCSGVEVLS